MRVTKIIEPTPIRCDSGWYVTVQMYIGNSYVYGVVICKTKEDAFSIKEGQHLNVEKMVFERRTNIM